MSASPILAEMSGACETVPPRRGSEHRHRLALGSRVAGSPP